MSLSALFAFFSLAGAAKPQTQPKPDHSPTLAELQGQLEAARAFNHSLADVGQQAIQERDALRSSVAALADQNLRLRREIDILHTRLADEMRLRAYYEGRAAQHLPLPDAPLFEQTLDELTRAQLRAQALCAQHAAPQMLVVRSELTPEMLNRLQSVEHGQLVQWCSCTPPGRSALFMPNGGVVTDGSVT